MVLYEYCLNGCYAFMVIGKPGKFSRIYECKQCGAKLIFEKELSN